MPSPDTITALPPPLHAAACLKATAFGAPFAHECRPVVDDTSHIFDLDYALRSVCWKHQCPSRFPMLTRLNPTTEQLAVLDAVTSGDDLKVKAYASAGKTSTLRMIADRLADKRGNYLAWLWCK